MGWCVRATCYVQHDPNPCLRHAKVNARAWHARAPDLKQGREDSRWRPVVPVAALAKRVGSGAAACRVQYAAVRQLADSICIHLQVPCMLLKEAIQVRQPCCARVGLVLLPWRTAGAGAQEAWWTGVQRRACLVVCKDDQSRPMQGDDCQIDARWQSNIACILSKRQCEEPIDMY
jgi:hypothetical protein